MSTEPFVESVAGGFQPTRMARGVWNRERDLHARVVIGLLAHEIERAHGAPGFVPARLTVDLYRMPGLARAEVVTRLVRAGRRIVVADAEFISDGVPCARATSQLLRQGEQPTAQVWRPKPWNAPAPETITEVIAPLDGMWEMRRIPTPPGAGARMWMRETDPLLDDAPYTPFTRVAVGVDFASPNAHAHAGGLDFINSDITLYLARPVAGEWIGYEAVNHQSANGVAVGECTLHDQGGAIGFAACAALAQKMG
jgi:hypothetical protein